MQNKVCCDWKSILYPFTVVTHLQKLYWFFSLKCLIIQRSVLFLIFKLRTRTIKHVKPIKLLELLNMKHITTPYFNLYLFTCLGFSCTAWHKATFHVHLYLKPLFSIGSRLTQLCDPCDGLQSFNVHMGFKR